MVRLSATFEIRTEDGHWRLVFDDSRNRVVVRNLDHDGPAVIFPNEEPRRWRPNMSHCTSLMRRARACVRDTQAARELAELQSEREVQGR